MRPFILMMLLIISCVPGRAIAEEGDVSRSVSADEKASFAGEWRAHRTGGGNACGAGGEAGDISLVLEFALTGGKLSFDDGSEASGSRAIQSLTRHKDSLDFAIQDSAHWLFQENGKRMDSLSAPAEWDVAKGTEFHQCRTAADRSTLKLNKNQIAAIAADMPPANAVFVDMRAKGGCKALDFQYVFFDLVGPLGFKAGRWNSTHLAEQLAEGKMPKLATDEIANWSIDKAEAVAEGYRLTITELIPPNGSRGDTATITLTLTDDGSASIPEWKRTYIRCRASALANP